jgi:MFS family permease
MWIGGVGIIPMSAGWFVSQQFGWLLIVQFCSGAMWAAYELAFFLIFLDSIPEQRRTDLLTLFNLFNAGASVVGALLGSAWLLAWDASYQSYLYLFLISSGFRCLTLLFLWRVPESNIRAFPIGFRTLAVRPNSGSMSIPVLPSIPDES